jgi:hypothetical protein
MISKTLAGAANKTHIEDVGELRNEPQINMRAAQKVSKHQWEEWSECDQKENGWNPGDERDDDSRHYGNKNESKTTKEMQGHIWWEEQEHVEKHCGVFETFRAKTGVVE